MRAAHITAFGGTENLRLVGVPRPQPRANEALIRVAHCGVNAVDRSQLTGRWTWLPLPHTPGSEISGTVEAVGDSAGALHPGQKVAVSFRVFCGRCHYCLQGREEACNADPHSANAPIMVGLPSEGGYADYVLVPAQNVVPLPDNVDLADACAAALDGVTAWHEVERAQVHPGDRVLVTGSSGGLGTFFVQLAKQRGAVVFAVTSQRGAADRLRGLGADAVIDRTTEDVAARARALTGGRGVDVVLDATGAATLNANLAALGPLGRLAICGILTGADARFNLAPFYAQQQQIIGSTGGTRRDLVNVVDTIARGIVTPVIWRHFPLTEAAAAIDSLNAPDRFGKVLLDVAP